MKKVFVSIIALITINQCHSQTYITFGTKAFSANPFYFSMGGGHIFNNGVMLDLEGKLPVSQRIDLATHLSGAIGYEIPLNEEQGISAALMVGEALNYRSSDKKWMNTWTPTGAIRLTYKWVYVQPTYIEEQLYLGVGIVANLSRH